MMISGGSTIRDEGQRNQSALKRCSVLTTSEFAALRCLGSGGLGWTWMDLVCNHRFLPQGSIRPKAALQHQTNRERPSSCPPC